MASTFAGAVATGGIATKRRKLGAEKATIFSANSGAGLGDTKLVGDMSRAQSWNGGLLSYLARQAARGAALGRAQTLDGVAIGQMLGNGFYNIGMASAAYRKLDSSLDRAEEWAKRQGGADVGDIVDQQFYLESSITSGRYSGSTLKMLQDMRGQRLRFASRGSAVGADGETLARGFTAADGRRYLSTDQKGSLQQQLAGLVTRAHERERNGLKDGAWGQTVEGFRAVVTHAGMGSMLDGQFGSIYGRSWQSPLLRDEISSYRRGDMRALLGSTVNNYDHSSGDNFKLLDNGTSVNDGTLDLNKNGETIITAEELAEMSEEEYIKTLRSRGLITAEQAASGSLVRKQFQAMQAANRYHQQFGPEGFQGDPARQQALGGYMQGVDRIWQGDRASVDYIIASSQGSKIKELDPWQREAIRVKSGSWFGDPRSQWDFRGNGKARISAEDVQNLQNQDKLHNLLWTDFGRDSALTIGGTALTTGLFKGAGSLISRLRNTVQPRAPGVAPAKRLSKTTVLGRYPSYRKLSDKLDARRFEIPAPIWNKMSPVERWKANQNFLDRMIARGDKIILSTPVRNIDRVQGYFRKELDYLIDKGYRLSANGRSLIK